MNFFKSNQVKVFPCAFRGTYNIKSTDSTDGTTITQIFDPESRMTSEYNFTHLASYGGNQGQNSYIIDWTDNLLKCIIAGYYFEISVSSSYFISLGDSDFYLHIATREVEITSGSTDTDTKRNTYYLANLNASATEVLDQENTFYGIGYDLSDSGPSGYAFSYTLQIFEGKSICYSSFLPQVYSGKASDGSAVSIGKNVIAAGKNSLAIGIGDSDRTKSTTYDNTFTAGNNLCTTGPNQVVVGSYNSTGADSSARFIVGVGEQKESIETPTYANGLVVTPTEITFYENKKDEKDEKAVSIAADSATGLSLYNDLLNIKNSSITTKGITKLNTIITNKDGYDAEGLVEFSNTNTTLNVKLNNVSIGLGTDANSTSGTLTLSNTLTAPSAKIKQLIVNSTENKNQDLELLSLKSLVDIIYPVGSIYITINSSDPVAHWPDTTWEKLNEGYVLQNTVSNNAGTTGTALGGISTESMPKITPYYVYMWKRTN